MRLTRRLSLYQTIHIADSPAGIQVTTRKTKATPGTVAKAASTSHIRPRSSTRRALGIVSASTAKRGYRPDLRAVSSLTLFLFVVHFVVAPRTHSR